MQLILVSGLSGSGKSIALDVLEDSGYYCVDNLPATLLLDVVSFLDEAGHDRVAVSVDARSVALASRNRTLVCAPNALSAARCWGREDRATLLASTLTAIRPWPPSLRNFTTSSSSVAGRLSTQ